jgi:diguanylate cyclase (GGDEF)-like protein/PAS domain S-box-containing protein
LHAGTVPDAALPSVNRLTVTVAIRRQDSRGLFETEFRAIVEALQSFSTILTLSDGDNRLIRANAAAIAFMGRSEEEIIGHSVVEFLSPASREEVARMGVSGADDGTYGEHEFEFERPDMTRVWGHVRTIRLKDGDGHTTLRISVVEDVTAQHLGMARETLLEAGLKGYEAMFERGSLGQLIIDFSTMHIDGANAAICALTGYTNAELVGSAVDLVIPDEQNPASEMAVRFADGAIDGFSAERVLRRRDGTTLPVLTTLSAVRGDDGGIVRVLILLQDLTPQHTATARRRQAEELTRFVARYDPLTGLLGRAALIERLNELASSGHGARALMIIDLDDFNAINDSLGHLVGDSVLLEVGSRLTDAFPGLLVAKYGGDKFAVVVPYVLGPGRAAEAAALVRSVLEADVEVSGNILRVTASIGIALQEVPDPSSPLVRNADSALSNAKHAGNGQHRVYDADMRRETRDRIRLQNGLRTALVTGQLHLAYQPIVALAGRRILGAEALLRWTHPERGPIPPVEFIPVAEQGGLILPIGQWVMRTACRDVLPLHEELGIYISVNASTRQLVGGGFAEWVEAALEQASLPPGALTIEVTEGALVDELDSIRIAFEELRSRGVRISIDDFGTGFSSLARLQRLPVDVIKLDRAFVTAVDTRPQARGMAAAILQMGAAIGATVVAEGVETEAEAATLLDLGYTMAQGYLFARPMPMDSLTDLLALRTALTAA